ncbi:retrotransposon gag domain-containing protein, partial [Salmonella enterica]|uniref:retrotransposon gag domain-containing protein n=1 Tax=Salmonella enterica TaxID=28901 RepID=UPI001F26C7BE
MGNKILSKPISHLMNITQRVGEGLQAYIDRFNVESRQCHEKDDRIMMGSFINGLRSGPLATELAIRPPHSYFEMLATAVNFAVIEDATAIKLERE